jgi:hypothetical protein
VPRSCVYVHWLWRYDCRSLLTTVAKRWICGEASREGSVTSGAWGTGREAARQLLESSAKPEVGFTRGPRHPGSITNIDIGKLVNCEAKSLSSPVR